jgi:transposase-like protein
LIRRFLIDGLRSRRRETIRKVTQYSEAFKSKMVQRMVGPAALSANRLSQEIGIGQPTLSKWLRQAEGRMGRVKFDSPPPPARSPRRPEDWSPEERLRAVMEASRLTDDELGAFLRREGIPETVLAEWRTAVLEALSAQRKPASDSRKVRELEKQLRRKDKALAEAAALLVLQKKVRAIWGDEDDDTGPKSDE